MRAFFRIFRYKKLKIKVMTTPISFELAKLLKEKGFDNLCKHLWHFNGSDCIKMINKNSENFGFSAPTIAEVVMWLYEKHGIWIVPSYELNIENHKKEWFWIAIKDGEEIAYQYKCFNSPTEAYEAAIEYCLTNLI